MRAMTILALCCLTGGALAEEKKPTGAWSKKQDGFEIKFEFKKDGVLVFSMANGNDSCEMVSKITHDKDLVKCKVTKFTKNGNFPEIKEGFEFTFKFSAKDKMAKISDIDANGIDQGAKNFVEGDYEMATD